jgi:hypothetical protein
LQAGDGVAKDDHGGDNQKYILEHTGQS